MKTSIQLSLISLVCFAGTDSLSASDYGQSDLYESKSKGNVQISPKIIPQELKKEYVSGGLHKTITFKDNERKGVKYDVVVYTFEGEDKKRFPHWGFKPSNETVTVQEAKRLLRLPPWIDFSRTNSSELKAYATFWYNGFKGNTTWGYILEHNGIKPDK